MKTKTVTIYASIKIDLEFPETMSEEEAIEAFEQNTDYNFSGIEDEGIIVTDTEFIEVSDVGEVI